MHLNSLYFSGENIPANMVSSVNDKAFFTFFRSLMCKNGTIQPGAYYQVIVFFGGQREIEFR